MSYDNTIPSADAIDLNNEYDRGFEAGMTITKTCKLSKVEYDNGYKCSNCDEYLRNISLEYSSFRFCPGCGAKITEVEK